ncbi:alpha/beta fold hydrolase [Nonomuraea sp. NPDC049419]|uniref:alpha/beta fold hydrolase n=1 Tax=Nonomuraea sp. NPDC049419 TaxID=3155772 RepID=UPI003442C3C2
MRSTAERRLASPPGGPVGGRRRELTVFVLIGFGIPWLLWLLRVRTGIDVVAPGGMIAVGLATFAALRLGGRTGTVARDTALVPIRPVRRLVRFCAIALGATLAFGFLAVAIGAWAGEYPTDLQNFSGLRAAYDMTGEPLQLILSALAVNIGLLVVVLPLALCEEWAWRGFLLPRLRQLGLWPALLASGLIWGVWHLPGYVGAGASPGFAPFLVTTVFFGVLLGWLRLASGLIWPGVLAHAANNTLVTAFVNVVFSADDERALSNPWTVGLSGWPGWLTMLPVILVGTRAIRRAAEGDPAFGGLPRRRPHPLRRILAASLGLVIVAALAGTAVEQSMARTDARRFPAPGRLVSVGTHQLHLRCLGSGSPAVVFESGWGDSSTTWDGLQRELTASGRRSCAYDRAGHAWSEPGPGVRDASAEAAELVTLLANAGERGPFVFVGHSWGGHVLRLLRAQRPGQVAGLVLLDIADERNTGLAAPATIQAHVWSFAAGAGLLRTGAWMVDPREPRLTRDNAPVVFGPATWAAAAAEMRAYDATVRAVRSLPRGPGSWGGLPLTVISAQDTREQPARLSTRGRHVVAATQDHYVHLAEPALVLREIHRVLEQAAFTK